MKRKTGLLLILLIVVLTITACGEMPVPKLEKPSGTGKNLGDSAGVSVSASSTISDSASASISVEEVETVEESARDIYAPIIDDYIAFYNSEKSYSQTIMRQLIGDKSSILNYGTYDNPWLGTYDEDELFEAGTQYMYSNNLSVDAVFFDANEDGIEELFIVESDDGYYLTGMIHDVWTIIDGKPYFVSYFDARYELVLTKEMGLIEVASSGWNSTYLATLYLNSDGAFLEHDVVEQVPDGESYYCIHNGENITFDEFNNFVNEYLDTTRVNLLELDSINIGNWEK